MKRKVLSERRMIQIIRSEYKKRLAEVAMAAALEETDMYDDRGNMLLTQDLKVRHKGSGYEYTVDHVEGEGKDATVYLRHPEEPRFVPPDSNQALVEAETTINLKGLDFNNMTGGSPLDVKTPEKIDLDKSDLDSKEPPSLLAVSKAEFEKDYEVQ